MGVTAKKLADGMLCADPVEGDSFTCMMSAETVDRDGEVLLTDGCVLEHYGNQVFFNHATNKLIGVCQGIGRPQFAPDELHASVKLLPGNTPELQTARNILRYAVPLGLKPGISVGFIRHETRKASRYDRERYGADCKRVTSKWELLELSIALVQCKRDAFITGVNKGYFTRDGLKLLGIGRKKIAVKAWSPPGGQSAEALRRKYHRDTIASQNPGIPASAIPGRCATIPKRCPKHFVITRFEWREENKDERLSRIVRDELQRLIS